MRYSYIQESREPAAQALCTAPAAARCTHPRRVAPMQRILSSRPRESRCASPHLLLGKEVSTELLHLELGHRRGHHVEAAGHEEFPRIVHLGLVHLAGPGGYHRGRVHEREDELPKRDGHAL